MIMCRHARKYALRKKRYLLANHKPFINPKISKAIMAKTRLRNYFLKKRSDEIRHLSCKQSNKCVSLLQIAKKDLKN